MKFERTAVDSHMHLRRLNLDDGTLFYDFFDGLQKDYNLKGLNICACTMESWGIENNILAALYKLHNPTAYAYGGFFYPDMPVKLPLPNGMDIKTQYNELLEMGFDGIKMLETKTLEQHDYKLRVDADYYEDFFAQCEKDGTHIIWHVADPDTFWDIERIPPAHLAKGWYYGNGDYMSWEDIYKMVFNVLDRHPDLKVTFAHFFFYSEHPEWLVEMFEKYPNVGVDVTPGREMHNAFRERNGFYKEFFIKYADRISFGTDVIFGGSKTGHLRLDAVYRFLTTDEEVMVVDVPSKGIKLPDDACDKILFKNFESAAGGTPKKIDVEKLKKYIQKYKFYITQTEVLAHLEALKLI